MFKKKDTPELYELLRKNRVEVGKPYPKETSASSASQPSAASPEEPHGAAPTIPELTAPSPYHKLRNPFPVKIEKPVKKTIGGKRIPANYNNLIFGAIIIMILAFVIYAVFFRSGDESAAAPGETPVPGGTVAPPPIPAPAPQPAKYWAIRLAYARDNTSERETILKLRNFLSDNKIADVSLEMETIKGSKCIVIYQGKYKTKDEAAKETARFRNLHFKFKECTVESRNAPK